jgi:hypothetical protein
MTDNSLDDEDPDYSQDLDGVEHARVMWEIFRHAVIKYERSERSVNDLIEAGETLNRIVERLQAEKEALHQALDVIRASITDGQPAIVDTVWINDRLERNCTMVDYIDRARLKAI